MPKAAPRQTNFGAGEVAPLIQGRTDSERYKMGLDTCINYIPTLQGPLIRRSGTKYMIPVKDSTNPPYFIPFKFSATQAYMLEVGDFYIRFYANNGQVVTSGTSYKVTGIDFQPGFNNFTATRLDLNPLFNEVISSSVSVPNGTILELVTPYAIADVPLLRWAQSADTLYIAHTNYPTYKLQRYGATYWTLKQVAFQDGPYLPLNSYRSIGDNTNVTLTPSATGPALNVQAGPILNVSTIASGGGLIRVTTTAAHGYMTGQKVYITGVVGTTEANNDAGISGTNTYWIIKFNTTTKFDLIGSTFSNAYISGGTVAPALFIGTGVSTPSDTDVSRVFALINGAKRVWGTLQGVINASKSSALLDVFSGQVLPDTTACLTWQMSVWAPIFGTIGGYPGVVCFHQDRLIFTGTKNYPQQIDGSHVGLYEAFDPSNAANTTVTNASAIQYVLNSSEVNVIRWMKSVAQGLLCGTLSSEWHIAPSNQSDALTPTNVNALQTSFYGSANIDAVQLGNAVLYLQNSQKKLRELTYFFQVGTFRSIDMTELSAHITLPKITKLAVQKESQPLVWAVRSDGALLSMVYNRDDVSVKAGWARHFLGGASDTAGTPPIVLDIAVIPDPTASFDQLYLITKRHINGANVVSIEYLTDFYNDGMVQEDSFQFDCGVTYDSPKTITAITAAHPPVVTAAAHGFSNGDSVKITDVIGLNLSTADIDGNTTISNLVDEKTFVIYSSSVNTFQIQDFQGVAIDGSSYSAYVSGGKARKLVSNISGLSWLIGETVSILADGGIHPNCLVNSSAIISLQFPAAKVQIGYPFNSDGKLLRVDSGAADGTSIGKTRRVSRVAAQVHQVGDFQMGTSFTRLIPVTFTQGDVQLADNMTPLFSGIHRDGVESAYDFEGQVCFRQNSGLPGMIQSFTVFMEEFDV